MRKLAKLLSVQDLAETWGVDHSTALRRLQDLDRQAGGTVILRLREGRRPKVFTTLTLLRNADQRFLEANELAQEELSELRKIITEQRKSMNAMKSQVKFLTDALEKVAMRLQSGAA